MKDDLAQSVIITLVNGKRLVFSGPVQVDPEDENQGILSVKFTDPLPLPEGGYWRDT